MSAAANASVMLPKHCDGAAELLAREWPRRSKEARCREWRNETNCADDRVHLVLLADDDEQVVVSML